jgi:SNF2 family DNA or RNA helicase
MEARTFDLTLPVELHVSGWNAGLARLPKIEPTGCDLRLEKPRAASLRLGNIALRTFSYTFPEAPAWAKSAPARPAPRPNSSREEVAPRRAPATRIKPPGDIIKLEDRLYYVLQPPLESLASSHALTFPFEPFPYQMQGIAFLFPRYSAILADEMGLGKTMQAISTMRLLLCSGEIRSVLLICPKPLVTNWQREFAAWAPEIALGIIEGDANKRRWQWEEVQAPVKIANYELLMRDRDILTAGAARFDLVVLDEAQRIKNQSSATSQIARAIPRSRSWALTGTPIENSPDDLVGIFEFLSPGYLSREMPVRRMGELVKDHILRRTKDKVLTELPPKLYRDAELDLTPQQRNTYQRAEDEGILHLDEMGEGITIQHVFELVLRLKQICNFDPATGASAKLERLEADLEEIAASGQKAIVFSQWVGALTKIRARLTRFRPLEYHGKIPSNKRDAVIKEFKEEKNRHVLLMSYGAGAVGLNLQFCQYVFLFDRWWNPAVEDQAINRAHRIGVSGPVTVTRMLAVETIEERINDVLERKRELFNSVLSDTGAPASGGLSQAEIFGLFKLRAAPPRRAAA